MAKLMAGCDLVVGIKKESKGTACGVVGASRKIFL